MRKLFLSSVAIFLAAGQGLAADAVFVDPAPVTPAATLYDWSGAYVGLHVGGGWGDVDFIPAGGAPPPVSVDLDGFFGGAQAGYDWQSGNWVFGGVVDFSISGIDGAGPCPGAAGFTCAADVDWLATARVRAGYAFDNILVYATGGLSVSDITYFAFATATGIPAGPGESDTVAGYNIGAGLEMAFNENWSADLHYLYHDFANTSLTVANFGAAGTGRYNLHTIQFGLNYRF